MKNKQHSISFSAGVSLAVGSIMGSGILFLPALTSEISGNNVFWVWIISLLLCVPLIYIFCDIVKDNVGANSLEKVIEVGLGKNFSISLPLLFLGTVSFGMPTAAFIVGKYVSATISDNYYSAISQYISGLAIILIGAAINLLGIKSSARIQIILSLVLFFVALCLFLLTANDALPNYHQLLIPHQSLLNNTTLIGIVVAFWAYAGFENLTFMSGEFANFKKDFKKSILTALLACGIIYALLSLNYAAILPINEMDSQLGLFQLSSTTPFFFLPIVIVIFAFVAVQINFVSWMWGISRLLCVATKNSIVLRSLSALNKQTEIPQNAIYFLSIIFSTMLTALFFFPQWVDTFLVLVSTNFVFIYILCLLSYILYKRKLSFLTLVASILAALLLITVSSSGWLVIYPCALVIIANIQATIKQKRKPTLYSDSEFTDS